MSEATLPTEASPAKTTSGLQFGFFSGRRGRQLRETLLAYGFLFPAIIIIGLFGLFPLVFSIYQSTRAGLNNVVGRPTGLGNYLRAIDNIAYILAFWLALAFFVFAIRSLMNTVATSRKYDEKPWAWAIPGGLIASGFAALTAFLFLFLPGLLEIGEKMRGLSQEERNEMFSVFLGEAWTAESVQMMFQLALVLFILGGVVAYVLQRMGQGTIRSSTYQASFITAIFLLIVSVGLTYVTLNEIQLAYVEALEEGESLAIWAQVVTISAGFVLLLLSWLVWQSAPGRDSTLSIVLRLTAGTMLLIGAWVLIGELPRLIAEGDSDWWEGLRTTIFYAAGTLPFQLLFGLLLATLLFQNIKGKGAFRIIYFLPYVTPAVGAAAVFRVMFSGNPNSPMNVVISQVFNSQSLGWNSEPQGIFQLIGEGLNLAVPDWAAGPSLALVVVIIFSIWRYVGYNTVFFLAGLGNIPNELYEAASIDGAGRWAQFRNVTLPLLSPTTYFLTILGVIGTFKAFNTLFVMRVGASLGTTDTASIVIFDAFNRDTRYGYAAALGVLLLIVIVGATAFFNRLSRDKVFYG